ncbi:N-acetylmuramoyl-L-alanine amidase family protein [Corallococcus llansteffanensis]|uniref:N-acetylmuramoyl-L-alanine amidase n=1 Tax=Corallococcus llansteffanensis TaxID=2316731 RepID=A0A3A8QD64_9BACT|nr:N-acetylmuramoyl-L-alanine amidase [Corallococcus llansteffanensis]RKH66577.1 N-acetylmuramoyl-L-alanine amidase [Corallococcus llansteffanensis]
MSPRRSPTLLLLALVCLLPALSGAGERVARIVIDPGHGGAKEGAKGPGEIWEKEIALQIAQRLREKLEAAGSEVFLTREQDTQLALAERVAFSNSQRPDLFLSIHANSMPTKRLRERTEGIETYFLSANASGEAARAVADRENAEAPTARSGRGHSTLSFILDDLARTEAHSDASRLAYAIHPRLVSRSGAADRGVQQAPFFVLTGVEAPAVLIEVGFISHPQEGARLGKAAYQEALAQAISEGVQAFLRETQRRDMSPSAPVAGSTGP